MKSISLCLQQALEKTMTSILAGHCEIPARNLIAHHNVSVCNSQTIVYMDRESEFNTYKIVCILLGFFPPLLSIASVDQ